MKAIKISAIVLSLVLSMSALASCSNKDASTNAKSSEAISPESVSEEMNNTSSAAFETIDVEITKDTFEKSKTAFTDTELSNEQVQDLLESAFGCLSFGDVEGVYTYTDMALGYSYLYPEITLEQYKEVVGDNINNYDDISFTISDIIVRDSDTIELANSALMSGAIKGLDPEKNKIDGVIEVCGVDTEFNSSSSVFLIRLNGEWKLDFYISDSLNSIGHEEYEEIEPDEEESVSESESEN